MKKGSMKAGGVGGKGKFGSMGKKTPGFGSKLGKSMAAGKGKSSMLQGPGCK